MEQKRIAKQLCIFISIFLLFTGISLDYSSAAADSLFACAQKNATTSIARTGSAQHKDIYLQEHPEVSQFIHCANTKGRSHELLHFTGFSFICQNTVSDICKFYFQKALSGTVSDNLSSRIIVAYLHNQDGSKS